MSQINHNSLINLGFTYHPLGYYCPPEPANCGMYRIDQITTKTINNKPVSKTFRAYLTHKDQPTIRTFETLEQLNIFHYAMCEGTLF